MGSVWGECLVFFFWVVWFRVRICLCYYFFSCMVVIGMVFFGGLL